jgi:hypothetical protein
LRLIAAYLPLPLLAADGFFEWRAEGKVRQPFYFRRRDESPFAFAGLFEHWERGEKVVDSCTLITTAANDLVRPVHERMPVIVPRERYGEWLDPRNESTEQLRALLLPFDPEQMTAYPVSRLVNSPANDSPPMHRARRLSYARTFPDYADARSCFTLEGSRPRGPSPLHESPARIRSCPMNRKLKSLRYGFLFLLVPFASPIALATPDSKLDADKISEAAGVKATTTPDGVVRIAWARSDVPVKVDGMPLKPFAGLGSWAAFTPASHGAMVMSDTVVFQDEVTPAMDAAFANGLEVTGLHNHFFYDEPKVYFMHIGGMGEPEKLAGAVKEVWDAIKKVRVEHGTPGDRFDGRTTEAGTIDASVIDGILGQKSQTQDGVVKVTIGREGKMHGVKVAGSMGLTTWAAFSGTDELAAVDGDFIMTASEVQPVLRALRKSGIHIVALHNHMIGEEPAFFFTHFWGKGASKIKFQLSLGSCQFSNSGRRGLMV